MFSVESGDALFGVIVAFWLLLGFGMVVGVLIWCEKQEKSSKKRGK